MTTVDSAMYQVHVGIKFLDHGKGLNLPRYESEEAAGFDLAAAVPDGAPFELFPTTTALVPTGIALELPSGYEAQVRPRSGLALKYGVTVLNTPGTIDSDYRGEIGIILINHSKDVFKIERGDRIAQMVIKPIVQANLNIVTELNQTKRGQGGFGSTG